MKASLKLLFISIIPFIIGNLVTVEERDLFYENIDYSNPEQLDGPFTGGFGEQTCHSCHFDYDLNQRGGSLSIRGLNDSFKPGKEYKVVVTVESERLEIGGFQMTARFKDGSQAGNFDWNGERLMLTPSISDTIQYLQHSKNGTKPTGERKISWSFIWKAPESNPGPVIFNIAANAGNNDDSAFGDWIYVKEKIVLPGR